MNAPRDFWAFFAGQTISNFGSSVTIVALPLTVFYLTGSALNLGATTAATFLPYLLFGLVIGAWVDRLDRRRLMIVADLLRGVVVATIPALAFTDRLEVWHVYVVAFVNSTLTICFDSAQFAAIPSLVEARDLVTANGRIQASYSTAAFAGPFVAGFVIARSSTEAVLMVDAASFGLSAVTLLTIRRPFNAPRAAGAQGSVRRDVVEGLRYVLGHPVLRNISIMMALVNLVGATAFSQIVLFATERLEATEAQVGFFFSAGSAGVIAFSLTVGPLRRRYRFGAVALGALALDGALTVGMAVMPWLWGGLVLWGLVSGVGVLFNITTGSLRQAIVPNHLLGRVMSVASVMAFSAIPLGTLAGGWLIERTGNVAAVYAGIGLTIVIIALAFSRSALWRAEEYLPAPETGSARAEGVPMETVAA